jgi:prolyl oligopeptidase
VANGDGGEFAHYLLGPTKTWTQVTQFSDQVTEFRFGRDGRLYLLSRKGAPRGKILRLPRGNLALSAADTLVPESEATIQSFTVTASRLYVADLLGGPSQLRLFDLAGWLQTKVPIPEVASVGQGARLGGAGVAGFLFLSP